MNKGKEVDVEKVKELRSNGLTSIEISKELCVSRRKVQGLLKELGLNKRIYRRLRSEDDVKCFLDLWSTGHKDREIARHIGVNHSTIANWRKQYNLKPNRTSKTIEMVNENEAKCSKCFVVKPIEQFFINRKGKKYEYRFSYCSACRKKQLYLNLNNSIDKFLNDKFNRLKRRCKEKQIPFDLDLEYFIYLYNLQSAKCFYTDEILRSGVGEGFKSNTLSVDKIIPEKGYIKGNVVFCCHRINTCKGDLTLEEMEKWMPEWHRRIMNKLNGKM